MLQLRDNQRGLARAVQSDQIPMHLLVQILAENGLGIVQCCVERQDRVTVWDFSRSNTEMVSVFKTTNIVLLSKALYAFDNFLGSGCAIDSSIEYLK